MTKQVFNFAINRFVFLFGIVYLSLFLYTEQPAKIAGKLWPVTTELEIITAVPFTYNGIESTRISGTMIKLRDCDFNVMRWYIKTGENSGTVESTFIGRAQSRDEGVQKFTGIIVETPPGDIKNTFSTVEHYCYGFRTLTKFYVGEALR